MTRAILLLDKVTIETTEGDKINRLDIPFSDVSSLANDLVEINLILHEKQCYKKR